MRGFTWRTLAALLAMAVAASPALAQEKREIHIINDNDAYYSYNKIYELKNVTARDILPYVENALRQSGNVVTANSLVYKKANKQYIVVTMPPYLVPHIDDLVKTLDRPVNAKPGQFGSFVMGDGIYDFAYQPRNRASQALLTTVRTMDGTGEGEYIYDGFTNMIYFKDSLSDGASALGRFKELDVPIPQVSVALNVYELSDSNLRELGVDWLQWKNGPGADLFSVGADMFNFQNNVNTLPGMSDFASQIGNAWGGFLFAPQIDSTYIRLLAQKGRSRVWTSGHITVLNQVESNDSGENAFGDRSGSAGLFNYTLTVTTNNQFLQKDTNQATSVRSNPITIQMGIRNPVIAHPNKTADGKISENPLILSCSYTLTGSNTVNISDNETDRPVNNSYSVASNLYAISGIEKIVGSFSKDMDVKQKNGIPWLSELPICEYIFGAVNEFKMKTRMIVTVDVQDVNPMCDAAALGQKRGSPYQDYMEWDNAFDPNNL